MDSSSISYYSVTIFIRHGYLYLFIYVLQSETYWAAYSEFWPKDESEYTVKDYSCVELEGLIKNNKHKPEDGSLNPLYVDQMRSLAKLVDKFWDSVYCKYCDTHVVDKNGQNLKETETSFSILLKKSAWLPSLKCHFSVSSRGLEKRAEVVLCEPGSLYLHSKPVESLLSDKVTYLDAEITSNQFVQFLKINTSVSIETVKNYLLSWSEREKPEVPAIFYSSLAHMISVYQYLGNGLSKQDLKSLLHDQPVIFVPDHHVGRHNDVGAGKMLSRSEVWIFDPTRLFDRHRDLMNEYHVEVGQKRTIHDFYQNYPDVLDLFKQEGRINLQPTMEEYIELQALLCSLNTPKDTSVLSDVLQVFATIGEALTQRPNDLLAKSAVKNKLMKQKVKCSYNTHTP